MKKTMGNSCKIYKMLTKHKPEAYNDTCYIVGGGMSLKDFDWSLLDDKFVIAINTAYSKLPDAQILYCTDPPWIQSHLSNLEKFKGTIYQGVINLDKPPKLPVIDKQWHLTGRDGLEVLEGCLRHGSNSAFAAINMAAVHLGFKKIYLLGIDMKWGESGKSGTSHWHSEAMPHKRIDGEAVYQKMKQAYTTIKKPLLDMGIEVINVNSIETTSLDTFPIVPLGDVFNKTSV